MSVSCSTCCQGFGTENIWVLAARAGPPSGQQLAGDRAWQPVSLSGPQELHLPLRSEGLHGGGVCTSHWAKSSPYPEMGDHVFRERLPGARLTCQKCWALPTYPELPGEEPVPHRQWLESLQHPLRMEHETSYGETPSGGQRSVQELGSVWTRRERSQILALLHGTCHAMT